jgi:hypothetical protein
MSETKESKPDPKSEVTTRDDATDLGVPMLPGDGSEPQGPEDALGSGPKRGDYSGRIGGEHYQPHEILPVENPKPGEPKAEAVPQRPHVEDIGDAAGEKGGVTTSA